MNGVTKLACSATSPLGKLWQQLPLNHWFGSSVWLGRARLKTRFAASAVTLLNTDASTDCQNVRPSGSSLPNHSAPPNSTAIVAYCSACWLCRAQMPELSYERRSTKPCADH